MTDKTKSIKCVRDARAYPPECFSLKTDGRKSKHVCSERRAVFIQWATYADGDGTHGYPGIPRMAQEVGLKERTLKRRLAELVELGCLPEATGPDGRIKLHGPRGTTERVVRVEVLPLPGSSAWFDGPDGKRHRIKLTPENIEPLAAELKKLLLGQIQLPLGPDSGDLESAVGPNSNPVGPNSTPVGPDSKAVGPDSKAVGPKPADFGPQPPLLPTQTATTTATNGGQAGEVGVVALQRAFLYETDKVLPASGKVRQKLSTMLAGYSEVTIAKAVEKWVRARTAPASTLRNPAQFLLDELPDFLAANTEEALAAADAAYKQAVEGPRYTLEETWDQMHQYLEQQNLTREEFVELVQDADGTLPVEYRWATQTRDEWLVEQQSKK